MIVVIVDRGTHQPRRRAIVDDLAYLSCSRPGDEGMCFVVYPNKGQQPCVFGKAVLFEDRVQAAALIDAGPSCMAIALTAEPMVLPVIVVVTEHAKIVAVERKMRDEQIAVWGDVDRRRKSPNSRAREAVCSTSFSSRRQRTNDFTRATIFEMPQVRKLYLAVFDVRSKQVDSVMMLAVENVTRRPLHV